MVDKSKLGQPVGTTLDRFIKNKQDEFSFATGELSQILRDIGLAGKIINREISRAGLVDLGGSVGEQNIQGENQQKLDVIANIRFKRALRNGGEVCAIVSEEDDGIIDLNNPHGRYIVAIDPLDGSSNIDVNVSIGTIFSVYRRLSPVGGPALREDVLQKGDDQVAAGYLLYGSSTMLVYSTGHGVNGFTYDPSLGEFFLSHPNMKTPTIGNIYSINEGSSQLFDPGVQQYIQHCKENQLTARYIGSLVGDFHRNMLKGGIYIYPTTPKAPNGKLRLLYECNALAYIIEQAGGKATDGKGKRILDLLPNEFHQRTPFFIGSSEMMEMAESFSLATADTSPLV
ncbi:MULTISPECIES: class 1 fructose-bisphosphatase [unclassified Imperialibacter]|uniref:class 1 fructose-bisphosphatase n=1 Tax=unclassified Imperialibacter TaxID=2629706 RepID=UPI0012531F29|nr:MULTISPECIES: class 1 fructose-bisphosphatase [unclassified Imperialibacter]CAD5266723.1 fructose-1,6-bisphosphatase I [Imperialibacter sp. 75]CAD5297289.1 fructose-1,6-bisphosphatase I [Imperialibacter sp. 89]VVT27090.1 fructose-1,6-bisphosphatase I [Imperialibacter sp. EC-SDR9]